MPEGRKKKVIGSFQKGKKEEKGQRARPTIADTLHRKKERGSFVTVSPTEGKLQFHLRAMSGKGKKSSEWYSRIC